MVCGQEQSARFPADNQVINRYKTGNKLQVKSLFCLCGYLHKILFVPASWATLKRLFCDALEGTIDFFVLGEVFC